MRSANSHFARALIMGACLTAAVSAHAAGGYDAYVGGALGPSSIDADCRLSTSCDDSDMGYKFYAGFELPRFPLPRSAVEVSYTDYGQATIHYTSLAQRTVSVSAVSFDLALRAQLVPNLGAVGRVGLAYVSAKGRGPVSNSSDSNLEPHLGLGLEYQLNRQLKLTGGFDFTNYDTGAESGSVHLFSLGLQAGF